MKNMATTLVWAALAMTIGVLGQNGDDLGLSGGYTTITTDSFSAQIATEAQVLVSLKPTGSSFDFIPFDYIDYRAANGQYHWGDITFRYREEGSDAWVDGDSTTSRQPVQAISSPGNNTTLMSSFLAPTLPDGPLNITREWIDVSGDLGLQFTIENAGSSVIELGSLGFPAEFNSIFTNRQATEMLQVCSLSDPYIGMHAGHIRVAPTSGTGPALAVTPLGDTPMEAYRNLAETYNENTVYGSQTFEGFYEWQTLTKAWAENEWSGASQEPWNPPSSRTLQPGENLKFGLRFSVATDGVRELDTVIANTGTPVARGIPGYIIPQGVPARLLLTPPSTTATIANITAYPADSLAIETAESSSSSEAGEVVEYILTPSSTTFGQVRLTVTYTDDATDTSPITQTVHYHITNPGSSSLSSLGSFLTTEQWFDDDSDPFNRSPSIITYDHSVSSPVLQDPRVWIAGLSDEAGAGSWLAACVKQAVQPGFTEQEVSRVLRFVEETLDGTIQKSEEDGLGVVKSVFFYEPEAVEGGYEYDESIDWTSWTSWDKGAAVGSVDRAYDYVHVVAAYWGVYRLARGYPALFDGNSNSNDNKTWEWYLRRAQGTIMRAMQGDVGYNRVGLMGETVFGEVLKDLRREGEGFEEERQELEEAMRDRATQWDGEEVPFGSEMAWDSTGQEGVYYWAKYFNFTDTATKALNSVLGFMPTVPHWGWNGNARRYWDNIYGGKLQRIERQIHHYGSALNAQVALSAFRSSPSDTYLLRVGYGGAMGPFSNIHQDGFAAASFHSWPDTLAWDAYSGDYGPGFLGMALSMGTYVSDAGEDGTGVEIYGGVIVEGSGTATVTIETTDPIRRKVFIGSLGLLMDIEAGIIETVTYSQDDGTVSLTLGQLDGGPIAEAAVIWLETTVEGKGEYQVVTEGATETRGGWQVQLTDDSVLVDLSPA